MDVLGPMDLVISAIAAQQLSNDRKMALDRRLFEACHVYRKTEKRATS
jgi:hypothetical protein